MELTTRNAGEKKMTMPGSGRQAGGGITLWAGASRLSVLGRDCKELREERQTRGTQEGRGAQSSPGNLL